MITGIQMQVNSNFTSVNAALIITSEKPHKGTIHLVDRYGKVLSTQWISITNGINLVPLNEIYKLSNSTYTVVLKTEEAILTATLV